MGGEGEVTLAQATSFGFTGGLEKKALPRLSFDCAWRCLFILQD